MVPEPRVSADIQPCGIAGQPCLGKHGECGTGAGGVGGAGVGEREPALEIWGRFVLDDGDAESGRHGANLSPVASRATILSYRVSIGNQ